MTAALLERCIVNYIAITWLLPHTRSVFRFFTWLLTEYYIALTVLFTYMIYSNVILHIYCQHVKPHAVQTAEVYDYQ